MTLIFIHSVVVNTRLSIVNYNEDLASDRNGCPLRCAVDSDLVFFF